MMEKLKLAVAEHTTTQSSGRRYHCWTTEGGWGLLVKEALHIQMTPSEEHFNHDGGKKD